MIKKSKFLTKQRIKWNPLEKKGAKNDDKEVKKYLLMSKKIKSCDGQKRPPATKHENQEMIKMKLIIKEKMTRKKNHLYCNSMIVGKKKKDEINDIKVLDVLNFSE